MDYVKPSCDNDAIDSGDTSWLLCSTALIMLMTIHQGWHFTMLDYPKKTTGFLLSFNCFPSYVW